MKMRSTSVKFLLFLKKMLAYVAKSDVLFLLRLYHKSKFHSTDDI